MKKILVSILIPVFNRENMIGECIQSALDQSYKNIEIIVVDNASTDNTWNICKKYAECDQRIKIFQNKENIGPVLNWKRCIDEATGVYGKILFSDDLIYADYLQETVSFLSDEKVGLVFTSVLIGESKENGRVCYKYDNSNRKIKGQEYIYNLLVEKFDLVSPGAALFRLADLRNNLIYDDKKIESPTIHDFNRHGAGPDLLLYLLTATQYPYVVYTNKVLAFFRVHDGSFSVADSKKNCYLLECYFQAKIWFAVQHDLNYVDEILMKNWIYYCRKKKNLVDYQKYIGKYLLINNKIKFSILLAIKMMFLIIVKKYFIKKKI